MVIHTFICDRCEISIQDTDTKITHKCPKCGTEMRWDLHGIGISRGDYEHVSDSLAIHPSQMKEHHEKFPGVDVLPDGRPRFTSVKQHDNYLDKIGMYKATQRIRTKGRKIKSPSN